MGHKTARDNSDKITASGLIRVMMVLLLFKKRRDPVTCLGYRVSWPKSARNVGAIEASQDRLIWTQPKA
jgi:hypothetical protein